MAIRRVYQHACIRSNFTMVQGYSRVRWYKDIHVKDIDWIKPVAYGIFSTSVTSPFTKTPPLELAVSKHEAGTV